MAWTTPRTWSSGELVTDTIMNAHVRDNLNAIGEHRYVRKSADETVTSSTVLQNDDVLLLAVAANEVWIFEFLLAYSAAQAGDLKLALTSPAGASGYWSTFAGMDDATNGFLGPTKIALDGTARLQGAGVTGISVVLMKGIIRNGGTAGNLQLQWAQGTSSATGTIVQTDSYLSAVRIA